MNVPRQAYVTTTSLYLPEAYCLDERSLFRDVDAAMKHLQGETLRTALKHLYIKWGDYCDEGRDEFAAEMLALANARNETAPRKSTKPRTVNDLGGPWKQTALF